MESNQIKKKLPRKFSQNYDHDRPELNAPHEQETRIR